MLWEITLVLAWLIITENVRPQMISQKKIVNTFWIVLLTKIIFLYKKKLNSDSSVLFMCAHLFLGLFTDRNTQITY